MAGRDKVAMRPGEPGERTEHDRQVQVPLRAASLRDSDSMIARPTKAYHPWLACNWLPAVVGLVGERSNNVGVGIRGLDTKVG